MIFRIFLKSHHYPLEIELVAILSKYLKIEHIVDSMAYFSRVQVRYDYGRTANWVMASLDDPLEGLFTLPSNCLTPAYCEIPFLHHMYREDPELHYYGNSLKIFGVKTLREEQLQELKKDLDILRDRWATIQFVFCFNVLTPSP